MSNISSNNKSTQFFKKGMTDMMNNMSKIPYTGDTDLDFAKQMLAHHKGAISMAKTEINFGKNPLMLKLANNIINTQEKQVEQMQSFISNYNNTIKWEGL